MDRREALKCGAVVMTAPLSWAGTAHALTPTLGSTTVGFATLAQGRAVLGADDDRVAATGAFHRCATLGVNTPVSRDQVRAFCADAVLTWTDALALRWRKTLAALAPRLRELRVPLPPHVLLIRTTGRDAANMPYTRANAVALPMAAVPDDSRGDAGLLAHELFHIVSRHAPSLATRLYALIGFEPVAPLQWPAEWIELRIANLDAPHARHLMRTTIAGRPVALMPLLVSRTATLEPGQSFADVMEVRLLEVTTGDATLPVRRGGALVWNRPEVVPEYLLRLGGNTGYIIHPEETMADNFALLVIGRPVPNPGLLLSIERVLRA